MHKHHTSASPFTSFFHFLSPQARTGTSLLYVSHVYSIYVTTPTSSPSWCQPKCFPNDTLADMKHREARQDEPAGFSWERRDIRVQANVTVIMSHPGMHVTTVVALPTATTSFSLVLVSCWQHKTSLPLASKTFVSLYFPIVMDPLEFYCVFAIYMHMRC